jgi:4-hydroxybenzoate polyprenyltransferase
MKTVGNYLSLVKFSHTVFAMPFAMIGFFLAATKAYVSDASVPGSPDLMARFFLVVLCMVAARSAAMAFNRYLDRHFDALNPRTAIREIPSGIISADSALWFTILMCGLFILSTAFINRLCLYLSPVALLVILGYSYTKRFTPLCHLILGLGLSLAPIGAYLAVTGAFHPLPILFSLAVLFWVGGFDIIYALQDEEFDRANGLHSIPSWLGKTRALRVSEVFHVLTAVFIISAGVQGGFGPWYWVGASLFLGLLVYQHTIVKPNDLSRVDLAFMTANGMASVAFAAFVIADLLLKRNTLP